MATDPVLVSNGQPGNGHAQPGLNIQRCYTIAGEDPLEKVVYTTRSSKITNPDGSVVFELRDVEVPANWSQLAVDILVSKYFRKGGVPGTGHEVSVKQVVRRLARTIRAHGEANQYFVSSAEAQTFEDELSYMLIHQIGAFNSPVWFNVGLHAEYGISQVGETFRYNSRENRSERVTNSYEFPTSSACFIQPVEDDLMSIFELVKNEARVFKYGSGTGTSFDKIRGKDEKLSGGGTSSGLLSWLKVLDAGAGSIKSGGVTRRAATMRTLSMDHPDIVDFITWKSTEEKKARALIAQGYSADFNGEAYQTIAGQNSNNSVRVTDEFMTAVVMDREWHLTARTTGKVMKTYRARELWDLIAQAAYDCADPGMQYDTTTNRWHTCPNSDRIRSSNPCGEYVFIDDTACNLASLNLVKFLDEAGSFDVDSYLHAVRVFFIAQEILVGLSSYPTPGIAENSYKFRPLGLGYANLGTLLMTLGMSYDSDAGRAYAACVTAIMHCHAGRVSAELAHRKGAFEAFDLNRESMLSVMRMHRDAVTSIQKALVPRSLYSASCAAAQSLVTYGEMFGYRNAQFTLLAPTGTIGLLMDCDTTGIEPDFALVKHKKLAGGGYFKIINGSVEKALFRLGYTASQIQTIVLYAVGTQKFGGSLTEALLLSKGLTPEEVRAGAARLSGAFTLDLALTSKTVLERLGVSAQPDFSLLRHLGFSAETIAAATLEILGHGTVEGAPGLKSEHYALFACANRCGDGTQFIAPLAHLEMMAAVQPFLSGAISKTCNVPNEATVEDIKELYLQGWKLGLKAIAIYRDGCKASQPLNSKSAQTPAVTSEKDLASLSLAEAQELIASLHAKHGVEVFAKASLPARRTKLSRNRVGITQSATIGGTKLLLRTGEYDDGKLGEIFIDMHKEGSSFRGMANAFAIAVSIGLQYGVPLEHFVEEFTFVRFEPHGLVQDDPYIKIATSVIDYVFRHVGVCYLGRDDLAHEKPAAPLPRGVTRYVERFGAVVLPVVAPKVESAPSALVPAVAPEGSPREAPELQHSRKSGAPFCATCGHQTVRNGNCFRCLSCGTSAGCS